MINFLSQEYPTVIYCKQFKFNYGNALVRPLIEWPNKSKASEEIELSAESMDTYLKFIGFATYNPIEDEYIIDNSNCFFFDLPSPDHYHTTFSLSNALENILFTDYLKNRINLFQDIYHGLTIIEGLEHSNINRPQNTQLYEIHENNDRLYLSRQVIQRCLPDSAFAYYTSTQWISVSKDQEQLFYTKDQTGNRIINSNKLQNIFHCFKNDEYEPFYNWLQPEEFGFCCFYKN